MTVTDKQVAILRAQLTPGMAGHADLSEQLDPIADRDGYQALVTAAFFEAVERRFGESAGANSIVSFVGDMRARDESTADHVDPAAAELLIRYSLGHDVSVDDLDADTKFGLQLFLAGVLVAEEEFDEAGMDAFIGKVRAVAEDWTK